MAKRFILSILCVSLILSLAACSKEPSNAESTSPAQQPSQSVSQEPKHPQEGGVGDTVYGGPWSLTLLAAKQYPVITSGMFESVPEEGKQFLVLFFEVENSTDRDDYFNYFNIESYIDDYSADLSLLLSDVDGWRTMSGDVGAHKKMRGYFAWEVPEGWNQLEVSYRELAGKDPMTFTVLPSDLSAPDEALPEAQPVEPDSSLATPVGTTVENDAWRITLSDVKVYQQAGSGYGVQTPEVGHVFLVAFLDAENISGADEYFNPLYIKSYVDGYNHPQKSLLVEIDGQSMASGDAAAGKKVRGYLAWEVPENWLSLEFSYQETTGDSCDFMVLPDAVSE